MNNHIPSIYIKVKAALLLLCLFLMMVNSCPIRNLLSSASFSAVETFEQSNNTKSFVKNNLHCSSKGKIIQATLLDFSKANNSSLPLPFLLSLLSAYLLLSVLNTGIVLFTNSRNSLPTDTVPLFLKNRSIII